MSGFSPQSETQVKTVRRTPRHKNISEREGGKIDILLLVAVLVLCAIGLYMVLSTTYYKNMVEGINPYGTFIKQAGFFAVGCGFLAFFATRKDYTYLLKLAPWLWIGGIVVLGAMIPFSRTQNGATRWLSIGGFSIQPSEFVKYTIPIAMAAWIQTHGAKSIKNYIVLLVVFVIPAAIVLGQTAMSMALIICVVGLTILFISGTKLPTFLLTVISAILVALIFIGITAFRSARVNSFFSKEKDVGGTDMQTTQAVYALAGGNLFGKGMNYSRQKYYFLPEAETDFVFSIFGEEFGFIRTILLVLLYAFVVWRGIKIAMNARSKFGAYTALGITTFFVLQACVNMLVSIGAMPVTGQPLPFISQGGSSILSYLMAFGILLNISKDVYE